MKQLWDAEELSHNWSLAFEELELLKTKPEKNHLAFCLQMKYYRYYGCFPKDKYEFTDIPLQYIVEQLEVEYSTLLEYNWSDRTARRHRQEILDYLGIRKLNNDDKLNISNWLVKSIFPNGCTTSEALDYVFGWIQQKRILRPAVFQLEKLLATAYGIFEKDLFDKISIPLTSIQLIDYCLQDKGETISFSFLKTDAGRISLDSVLKEIEKLDFINSLELPDLQFCAISSKVIERLRQRIHSETAWEVRRHPEDIRYALMSIFFYTRKSEIIDGLLKVNSMGNEFGPYLILPSDSKKISSNNDVFLLFASDNSGVSNVFFTQSKGESFMLPKPINCINSNFNDIYPSFNKDFSKLYFCSDRDNKYDIYYTNILEANDDLEVILSSTDYINVSINRILSSDFNDKCPFIFDSTIVFCSDRPGGYGGYDLYFSKLNQENWESPINFGETINSELDEFRPILIEEDLDNEKLMMIFSSNREGGIGGFDLYYVGVAL